MAGVSKRMLALGTASSEIREAFAAAQARAAEIGPEKVDDFSIGNPSVPAPESVRAAIHTLLDTVEPLTLHGYTPAPGDMEVRQSLAEDLNKRFGTDYDGSELYLTCGAAASLSCVLSALACEGDEFVVISPYFPEYKVFIETAGGTVVEAKADPETFQIDRAAVNLALSEKTKAVIINTPNNPTGAVYGEESLKKLAELLSQKSFLYGHPIYLISDEPYREISFTDQPTPWVPSYYANTIVCYSYSKSLSLPGQRIGYVLVPRKTENAAEVYAAVCGAGRALGYVCAPTLFQLVAKECTGQTSDVAVYRRNRDLLLNALREMGYTCAQPDGAFYLFPKALEKDARAFCQKAQELDLFLVPGDSFGAPGYVRISYCVPTEQVERSLAKFKKLAEAYGVTGG